MHSTEQVWPPIKPPRKSVPFSEVSSFQRLNNACMSVVLGVGKVYILFG